MKMKAARMVTNDEEDEHDGNNDRLRRQRQ